MGARAGGYRRAAGVVEVLITKTSGALYHFLCIEISDLATYQKTKLVVVSYCNTSS